MGLRDGMVLVFSPPPIRGLGTAGGFGFICRTAPTAIRRNWRKQVMKDSWKP